MRKPFSYLGGKYMHARKYGPPRRDVVCEPFAGGAGYSCYWDAPIVHLFDRNEIICAAWDWLINSSDDDVRNVKIPKSDEEYMEMPLGLRTVFLLSISFAKTSIPNHLPPQYHNWLKGEGHAFIRRVYEYELWNSGAKQQSIIDAKRIICNWTVRNDSYESIPEELMETAHFHVDPPYFVKGKSYTHSDIDYAHLGEWCRQLRCADVCEGEEADWLDFSELYRVQSANAKDDDGSAKKCIEMIWSPDHDHSDPQFEMFDQ